MVFTAMAALARLELEIKRKRILSSVSKRRAAGADLDGHPRKINESQLKDAAHLVAADEPVARNLGISRAKLYHRLHKASVTEPIEMPEVLDVPEIVAGIHPPFLPGLTVPIERI